MTLRAILTKPRSRERTLFAAIGIFLLAYAAAKVVNGEVGVAAFLAGFGLVLVVAARFCSERALVTLGVIAVSINVVAAVLRFVAP